MTKAEKYFVQNILCYYQRNKRELPWRCTQDPYKIWISEVMLQQTQVEQVLSYYEKFIQKFPNVFSLAQASEEEVLQVWQGLGYYSRARNLHKAAKQIAFEYKGKWPESYLLLLQLKGVGEYTAAAIASFAYNLPYAVLDGNVFRVLSRYFGIDIPINTTEGKKTFRQLAFRLLDKKNPSEYNQAIMEFGATCCKPARARCAECVLTKYCVAYQKEKVYQWPVKIKRGKKTYRYLNYFVFIENERYTYIKRRMNEDIWKGLYEFYLVETARQNMSLKNIKKVLHEQGIAFRDIQVCSVIKHILTHQVLYIQLVIVSVSDKIQTDSLKRVSLKQLKVFPFPVVLQRFIKESIG